jgi:hypothetical protein
MTIFQARYAGCCDECDEPIRQGDRLKWVADEVVHASCAPSMKRVKKAAVVCQVCWLVKPCGCDDEGRTV